jgi:DNA-binding transcriptional regulator YiaG
MGRQMSERAEFHVRGQPLDGTPLHYTASGLDYVYLLNGFTIQEDPDYGRVVSIDHMDDLHRAIGLYVIQQDRDLSGAEFRFLRKQMKLKQKELARRLGVDEQTVANYEKGKTNNPTSDKLMRFEFLLWIVPPDAKASVLKMIVREFQRRSQQRADMPPAAHPAIVKQWKEGGGDHHRW